MCCVKYALRRGDEPVGRGLFLEYFRVFIAHGTLNAKQVAFFKVQ